MNKKGFIQTFSIPELKSIFGKGGNKILILTTILLASLIVIGIANGAKEYLQEKMESPWIKFIDIEIGMDNFTELDDSKKMTIEKLISLQPEYDFKDPFSLKNGWLNFKNEGNENIQLQYAIMDTKNPFYQEIIKEKNKRIITGPCSLDSARAECIVTKKGLEKLGHDLTKSHLKWYERSSKTTINIPITGVVDDFKDGIDFIITQRLYDVKKQINDFKINDSSSVHHTYLKYFIDGKVFFDDPIFNFIKEQKFEAKKSESTHIDGFYIESPIFSDSIKKIVENHLIINKINFTRLYDLKKDSPKMKNLPQSVDYYTLFFNEFEKIPAFADLMENKYGIVINKTDIENKKNFTFFKKLINLLAYALIIFSILSIIFFITNLILSHINSNKKNMGTLKAFGLDNFSIIVTYSFITFALIIICFSISYVASELLGKHFLKLLVKLTNSENGYLSEVAYTNINIEELFVMMAVIPCIFILFNVFKYLNGITPGDLIYGRK